VTDRTERPRPVDWPDDDEAVARLEDVLLALPFDRALPPLEVLLERAGIPLSLLQRDERACKVLHEAILARPLGRLEDVATARTEVELLTLEIEVLTDRLADPDTADAAVAGALERLDVVRRRLTSLRAWL
jgi:hypothetical protein